MRIIFFGSSDFSLPSLDACLEHDVILVITTPDQPKGRGLLLQSTPVKLHAQSRNIPLIEPATLKNELIVSKIKALKPDLFVVASYGKIIPADWLAIPAITSINVHPSLIPKYRGAAPIQWAILNGDHATGVTLMEVTPKLDAGCVFRQESIPISAEINATALTHELATLSGRMLASFIPSISTSQRIMRTPQVEDYASYARKLSKEDGFIKWANSGIMITNQIRGTHPWPLAQFKFNGHPVAAISARLMSLSSRKGTPGEVLQLIKNQGIEIQAADTSILLTLVKPAGKNTMNAFDYANGQRIKPGDCFQSA